MPGNIKCDTLKDGELRQSVIMWTFQWQIGLVHQSDALSEVVFYLVSKVIQHVLLGFLSFSVGQHLTCDSLKPHYVFMACLYSLKSEMHCTSNGKK